MKKYQIHIDSKNYIRNLHYDGEGDEFYRKYQNMWIAIADKKVIAFGENMRQVKQEAARKTGKAEEEIPVKFIESIGSIFSG